MAEFLRLRQQHNVLSKPARKTATDDARRRKTAAVGFGDADDLVLGQPLKLGLNCICTTDFQSVGGNLCRRTGSPSYPKIEP